MTLSSHIIPLNQGLDLVNLAKYVFTENKLCILRDTMVYTAVGD